MSEKSAKKKEKSTNQWSCYETGIKPKKGTADHLIIIMTKW